MRTDSKRKKDAVPPSWTDAMKPVSWTGPSFVSYRYNSTDIAGCGSTSLLNCTQSFITNYEVLGRSDGLHQNMDTAFVPYPDGDEDEQTDYVDASVLFVRLCTADFIYGNLLIGGGEMNSGASIQVPTDAAGQTRSIDAYGPLFITIDVEDTTADPSQLFSFQTNSEIVGSNSFFLLIATLHDLGNDPDSINDPKHFYSVRHTTVESLEGASGDGPFSGYLIDGGEKKAKCHFILENDFPYFMFNRDGREHLNYNLSQVFLQEGDDGQLVSVRLIAMPKIQKNEPCVWPEEPEVIRQRMIVRSLNTVDDDFNDTHAGVIVHRDKADVVNWLYREPVSSRSGSRGPTASKSNPKSSDSSGNSSSDEGASKKKKKPNVQRFEVEKRRFLGH